MENLPVKITGKFTGKNGKTAADTIFGTRREAGRAKVWNGVTGGGGVRVCDVVWRGEGRR